MIDMNEWLYAQIDADMTRWVPVLTEGRRGDELTAREHLARCEAHRLLLRSHYLVHNEECGGLYCVGCGFNEIGRPRTRRSVEYCPVWRAVALAYRHRPGYRPEWQLEVTE